MRVTMLMVLLLAVTGCWNEQSPTNIRLGDVSLGQQLIDLKAALEAEALTEEEYEAARSRLIAIMTVEQED